MKKAPVNSVLGKIKGLIIKENEVRVADSKELKDMIMELTYALLQLIPMGYVTTYKDLSTLLGINPRNLGRILSLNRNPIVVPCHRVIRSDGSIGEYTLFGKKARDMKIKLLKLEGVHIKDLKVAKNSIISISKKILEGSRD